MKKQQITAPIDTLLIWIDNLTESFLFKKIDKSTAPILLSKSIT
jgi:hypothetical protein